MLSIDQGTTSTRAIVFDTAGSPIASAQRELRQIYPKPGWVEHDPEEIWDSTLLVCREVLEKAERKSRKVVAIGITNQRETTLIWDRKTGTPVANAIVWQDRRTTELCAHLKAQGHEEYVTATTGLVLDPYFSATKINWILDNHPGVRERANRGELAFGTIDSFLLWRLTGGNVHATDATNAARTMLYDIHNNCWDQNLLQLFNVPAECLPKVKDSSANFGATTPNLFGRTIPITGLAGDQQAATVGQACFQPGMIKCTYGTGCFALLNTGPDAIPSTNRLLTTIAYRLDGKTTYALEGSIFAAGAAVQWLRDGLGVIDETSDTEKLARGIEDTGGLYVVPAFTGLGAPYWDPDARGAITGLTFQSGVPQIARATLEAVCYQTYDLLTSMTADGAAKSDTLRVDGGMIENDWLMQFLADILEIAVDRPKIGESTALGAAFLAGLHMSIYGSLEDIARKRQARDKFLPAMRAERRVALLTGWNSAVRQVATRS
ncbi:MAG TPA: glycerol kinase GlpK [Sneathiellales bacterium]|nr:glycerol kinase GlpK [Sneathiellales bacterium]